MSVISRIRTTIDAQADALSPKDSKLLGGLLTVFLVAILGGGYMMISGAIETKEAVLQSKLDTVEFLEVAAAELVAATDTIAASETRLEQYKNEGFKPFVEKIAKAKSIELNAVTDQGSESIGGVKQTKYKVSIKRVELSAVLDFILALETSGYPMRIENAHFKTVKASGEKVITLTLEVVALTLVSGGAQ
jgi:hypothetical protein